MSKIHLPRKRKNPSNDNSVRLGVFDGADLRLTPQNTLFVMLGTETAWPYLRNGGVYFDIQDFGKKLSKTTLERIEKVLLKQKEIREKHALDFDEADEVYEYS